jgi:hypothetical protein
MRGWDIRRPVEALRQPELFGDKPVHPIGVRHQAVNARYASFFVNGLASVGLRSRMGVFYLEKHEVRGVPQRSLTFHLSGCVI